MISAVVFMSTFFAQSQGVLTVQDYQHAESFLGYKTAPLIRNANVRPVWMDDDNCWFVIESKNGKNYFRINAKSKKQTPLFDEAKLAQQLSQATHQEVTAPTLSLSQFTVLDGGKSAEFNFDKQHWKYDLATNVLTKSTGATPHHNSENGVLSPDKKFVAYIKDYNLWVKDLTDNKETQLTTDGVKDFGYATDNAGWKFSDQPILRWSPDSKKIATFQQDERNVGEMYLVSTNVGHPKLTAWRYPLPGDKNIVTIQRVIIDVPTATVIRLQIPADPHRGTLSDDISSSGTFDDVDWSEDAAQLAFVSTSRDHKVEKIRIADATTGAVKDIFEETVATQYESGQGAINWRYLPRTKEFIWYSERDNFGHLYLYDAVTGKMKTQITKGDFVVTKLLKVDAAKRELYFLTCGNEKKNPYFSQLCKVKMNGTGFQVLTPEEGNHSIAFSPVQNYFVDTYSQPDVPPVTVLRHIDGQKIKDIATADISELAASGWKAPIPVTLKAGDGVTDVYGLVFTPTKMVAGKKYPVIDYIYPGPQGGSVGNWSFAASRNDNQSLAELGSIVVVLEGTSNPLRSKSFHDMSYGNMAINTLPDQIAAIRQLAQIYPMDTSKVGIWGHSGGGFATACAMFKYPDFFKVGIAESGNHENRNYEDDWGERYNGLAENSDYAAQANALYAKNLKGKLFLIHGMMDENVPPSNTLLVVDALTQANKDFDLLLLPQSRHGYGPLSPYVMRRRWDYFAKNLFGLQPPHEYQLGK